LDDLRHARAAAEHESHISGQPRAAILRKDFIIDPYQLHEALSNGADSVLLIVASLTETELRSLLNASRGLGMEPLVEVADEYEMQRALSVGATFIGVNARDLHTFQVSVNRAAVVLRTASHQPNVTLMGLSGVYNSSDMEM
jgi:indole-3-glycerol phosphate synthase